MADDDPFGSLHDDTPFGAQAENPTATPRLKKAKKPKPIHAMGSSSNGWLNRKTVSAVLRVALVLGFFLYRFIIN